MFTAPATARDVVFVFGRLVSCRIVRLKFGGYVGEIIPTRNSDNFLDERVNRHYGILKEMQYFGALVCVVKSTGRCNKKDDHVAVFSVVFCPFSDVPVAHLQPHSQINRQHLLLYTTP